MRRLPPTSRVVVIDDVMVTGATLRAAMGFLIRDGHHVVAAVVAARVTRSR
ncbi:phosphoribosyltransferase family protein [Pontimonas sp.]|nr:phosphoribosyltransferase family protein [Pontimonas sp.]